MDLGYGGFTLEEKKKLK